MQQASCTAPKRRIFLVDDDRDTLQIIAQYLGRKGFVVVEFSNPVEALATIATDQPDLLITDFIMPRVNGITVAQETRLRHPKVPIIIASGNEKVDVPKGLGVEVFKKPPDWPMWLTKISELMSS